VQLCGQSGVNIYSALVGFSWTVMYLCHGYEQINCDMQVSVGFENSNFADDVTCREHSVVLHVPSRILLH